MAKMPKIAVNLLPAEFITEQLKNAKFYKVQSAGIAIVMLMIFLSSVTVALRFLQSQKLSQLQTQITASEEKISNLKSTESSLFLLKNRLTTINKYLTSPSQQAQMYKLIMSLLPSSVSISSISVDRSAQVLVSATTADADSLDLLITNLTQEESNEDKIAQVSLENVNRGRDGIYRISLKIKPK